VSLSGLKDPAGRLIEQTLVEIISEEGSMEPEAARAYLDNMSNDGRYQKELY
jgi:sulfite reductase alpha subunit-like flavoprotein